MNKARIFSLFIWGDSLHFCTEFRVSY